MRKIITAFATDDGKTYVERHFGDAAQYEIYEIGAESQKHIRTIINVTDEEKIHADANKAKGVAGLFKKDGVQVLVSKKFGGNINRMKKKFVCILMNDPYIPDSIKTIQRHFEQIVKELEKGEERHFLNLKSA